MNEKEKSIFDHESKLDYLRTMMWDKYGANTICFEDKEHDTLCIYAFLTVLKKDNSPFRFTVLVPFEWGAPHEFDIVIQHVNTTMQQELEKVNSKVLLKRNVWPNRWQKFLDAQDGWE